MNLLDMSTPSPLYSVGNVWEVTNRNLNFIDHKVKELRNVWFDSSEAITNNLNL